MDNSPPNDSILHILLFGFHHKIGYQMEFCYPPLNAENSHELPENWKQLPCIALPDGAHEYIQNSVYFTLPGKEKGSPTVFGVACHRQEAVENLKEKSEEFTRSSVIKSIVILMHKPAFGYVRSRLHMLTELFFHEGCLKDYKLLQDAFFEFSQSLTHTALIIDDEQSFYFSDLSARDLLLHYRHNLLILFKLLLLQGKVIYLHDGDILGLSTHLLCLISLMPAIFPIGLIDCATNDKEAKQIHPEITVSNNEISPMGESQNTTSNRATPDPSLIGSGQGILSEGLLTSSPSSGSIKSGARPAASDAFLRNKLREMTSHESELPPDDNVLSAFDMTQYDNTDWAFPLAIFGTNRLFLPYASLFDKDVMLHSSVLSYHAGCNNAIFRSFRDSVDAMIGPDPTCLQLNPDVRRQTQLSSADLRFMDYLLSVVGNTQEGLPATVSEEQLASAGNKIALMNKGKELKKAPASNIMEHSSWVGSNDWIREHFRSYLQSLLMAATFGYHDAVNDFNPAFVSALKGTHHYQEWLKNNKIVNKLQDIVTAETQNPSVHNSVVPDLQAKNNANQDQQALLFALPWDHPGRRPWHLNDLRLKMTHLLSNTTQGKKINTYVQNTSKIMSDTSKAVYGAAKSMFHSFWSSGSQEPPTST